MVLADFSGVPAGTKATVVEIYDEGLMLEWDELKPGENDRYVNRDGFGREELEYLAFETQKHPKVDPAVNRVSLCCKAPMIGGVQCENCGSNGQ